MKKFKSKIKQWIINLIGLDWELDEIDKRLKAFEKLVEIGVDVGVGYRGADTTFVIVSRLGIPNGAGGTVRIFDKNFGDYGELLNYIRHLKNVYNPDYSRIRMDAPRGIFDDWRERV